MTPLARGVGGAPEETRFHFRMKIEEERLLGRSGVDLTPKKGRDKHRSRCIEELR